MNWFLRSSILLNVALVGVAVLVVRRPVATIPPGPAVEPAALRPTAGEVPPEPAAPAEVIFATNDFHWRWLEATNYDVFVANLRRVDCPERTIRDIIFADAERRYADLEFGTAEPIPFWLAGKALVAANRRNESVRTEAQESFRAELRRLFGVDWSPEEGEARDVTFQALSRLVIGPVSDEQHERAWRWLMSTVESGQSFRRQRQHLLLETDLAEWQKIVAGKKVEVGKIFAPAAYEEFQARTTLLEEMFAGKFMELKDLELTPDETRKACLVKVREVGWLGELFEQDRRHSDEDREAQKIVFTAALKDVLSPDHFEEFVRVQDDDYRNILDVTRDHDLPRSSARKVYEVRQLAQAEYQRLRSAVADAEKADALEALQVTTSDSIRKILGVEAFNSFAARSGQWVTNVSKL